MFIAQCAHDIVTSYGLIISMLLAGLVGGLTHCVGMCSPFVLAQIDSDSSALGLKKLGRDMLLPYHLGRMTTYVGMAVVIHSLINLAFVYSDLKTLLSVPMLVLAGVIFLVSAFPDLSGLFPWVAKIRMVSKYNNIVSYSKKLMENQSVVGRYMLGVMLGFMPCGLVISALLASATAETVLGAGVAMMFFSIGTVPSLVGVSLGGRVLKKRYPVVVRRVSQGAMIVSSLWLFALAGNMVL